MGVRTMEGEKTINISEKYMLTIDEAAQYFNIGKINYVINQRSRMYLRYLRWKEMSDKKNWFCNNI
mgnify:CR=1 FL=1